MRSIKFLATILVGLIWASAAWATCGDGASTCFWVGGTGNMNFTSDGTLHWATSSNGSPCSCEPVAGDSLTFDGSSGGGTITQAANTPAMNVINMGAYTGTFDDSVNNNTVTAKSWVPSGGGTHTVKMGTGNWTINGTTGTVVDCSSGTANLTLTPSTSNLIISSTPTANRTFNGCGAAKPFGTITLASGAPQWAIIESGNLGAANVTFTAPVLLSLTAASTLQVNNAVTWNGSSGNNIFIKSNADGSTATIHLGGGAGTGSWIAIKDIVFNTNNFTCTTCFDLGNNTGSGVTVLINAPVLGTINAGGIIGG